MRKLISVIIVCLLLTGLSVTAWAETAEGTVTEEVNEDGYLVTTFTDKDGNVFSIEEMPDIDDGAIEPVSENASEEQATEKTASADESTAQAPQNKPASAWVWVLGGVVVIGAGAAVLLKRKK